MNRTSRIPGFYKHSVDTRRRLVAEAADLDAAELTRVLARTGGLDVTTADKTVENVLGTYALPFSLGLNVRINGRDWLAPMVVEEPSVVAAASNAARMIREGGGFEAEADEPLMVAQVQFWDVRDPDEVRRYAFTRRRPLCSRWPTRRWAASWRAAAARGRSRRATSATGSTWFTSWSTCATRWAPTS